MDEDELSEWADELVDIASELYKVTNRALALVHRLEAAEGHSGPCGGLSDAVVLTFPTDDPA